MAQITRKSRAQEAAEAEIASRQKDLGPFVVAAATTRMAMVFTDAKVPGDPIIFTNDSFLSLTGYEREEVLGKSFNFLMAHVATSVALDTIEANLKGGVESTSEHHCRRKDGSEFWAAIFISPVLDENGEVVQHFASFVDLTRLIEERAHSKMLIEELNHRVKNTLSTVQAIVWQALRTSSNPDAIRQAIESRLFALSRSHDLLTQENWEGAGLLDLVNAALAPFGGAGERAKRLNVSGENVCMPPQAALALGIAFHELATNAVKYGALSTDAGSVQISWMTETGPDGERLIIRWEEKGGPVVTPPSRRGFGSQVLENGLAHQLRGAVRLNYAPDGLVCTIDVPAPTGRRGE